MQLEITAKMEFFKSYGDDDYDNVVPKISTALVTSAPIVSVVAKPAHASLYGQTQVMTNPKADVFLAQSYGPAHPFKFNVAPQGTKQSGMGTIEETSIENWTFNEQYQTYQRSGYAVDISTNEILGDVNEYMLHNGDTAQNARGINFLFINKKYFTIFSSKT